MRTILLVIFIPFGIMHSQTIKQVKVVDDAYWRITRSVTKSILDEKLFGQVIQAFNLHSKMLTLVRLSNSNLLATINGIVFFTAISKNGLRISVPPELAIITSIPQLFLLIQIEQISGSKVREFG
jgi:hypothetical protein